VQVADDSDDSAPTVTSQLPQVKASLEGLATITQLQELCVACCESLGMSSLLPLTSLTALSAFTWRGCGRRWWAEPVNQQGTYELELYALQVRPPSIPPPITQITCICVGTLLLRLAHQCSCRCGTSYFKTPPRCGQMHVGMPHTRGPTHMLAVCTPCSSRAGALPVCVTTGHALRTATGGLWGP
jgi:hypothetical protein